jgi:hypothetical protein
MLAGSKARMRARKHTRLDNGTRAAFERVDSLNASCLHFGACRCGALQRLQTSRSKILSVLD